MKIPGPFTFFLWSKRFVFRIHGLKKRVWRHHTGKIHFWRGGKGPSVLFIHGLGGSTIQDFSKLVVTLSTHYDVISLDLPGYGLSANDDFEQAITNHVSLLREFLLDQKIENPTIIGNSMGGWITLSYCLRFPNHARKIILLAPAGIDFDPPPPEIFLPEKIEDMNRLLKYLIYNPPVLGTWILRDWLHFMVAHRKAIQHMINKMLTRQEVLSNDQIAQIRQPTLILFGEEDLIIPAVTGKTLHKNLPQSELVIYQNCGHLVQATHFEAVSKKISDFLSQNET